MVNVYLLDYIYMIIIVDLMYMDEEPNYSLESLNKPLLLLLLLFSSNGSETWKNFSVEANSRFADSQFDGIYLFIK